MKRVAIAILVVVFACGSTSAFAGGMPSCASKKAGTPNTGKALSKDPNKGSFQASADHISKWGNSSGNAKQMSLRGNKAELAKRRGCPK